MQLVIDTRQLASTEEEIGKQLKLEESLNFHVRRSTQLIYMAVLSSSLTTASTYGITYTHREYELHEFEKAEMMLPRFLSRGHYSVYEFNAAEVVYSCDKRLHFKAV